VDILRALDFSQKWNLKMVIKGGAESWLVATELAEMKVPVIVRPGQQGPWDFDSISSRDDLPKLLQDAGVPLIISAFGYFQNAGRLRQEAAFGIRAGLTKAEALTAISWRPAQLFSGEAYVGRIAKGADADLVLWNGDPFELNHSVERMWIRGEKQSLEDRALLLAKRYYGKLKVFHELPMALE